MAANGNVRVPADSTGKRVDAASLDDAAVSVYRQKMVVSGYSGTAEVVSVLNTAPAGTEYALAVRQVGTASVVAVVSGQVSLGPGTSNIGSINNISATVAAVLAAGTANIGTLNNISATVAAVLAAGTANIGSLNNISASVMTAVKTIYASAAVPSATRGPRHVVASTSANATLIAAPGAGMAIYITSLSVSNASGTNVRSRVGTSASIGQVTHMLAASGGGFVTQYNPPWMLSTNEACVCSIKPNASEGLFNIHYYVASADAA